MEAATVPDKAVISHRGEKYEIGRGKRFYGIWSVGAPYDAPVDRWPENRDGWEQAWSRFATIETPGSIAAVTSTRPRLALKVKPKLGSNALLVGEGLLVLGVVLGLVGIFPAYIGSTGSGSLLSQADQVVPHLCYIIGWAVCAAMIALSSARPATARLGALFGLGLSAVTFGLFLADLGEATSAGASIGVGLVVSLLGWLGCTVGSALALGAAGRGAESVSPVSVSPVSLSPVSVSPVSASPVGGRPVRPQARHAGPLALLVLAAIGTAAAFAPSWDSYVLSTTATGSSQTVTAGNAFDNPGLVIAGDVATMVAVVVVAALAALWRPPRQGALLLAGAIVPLAAQAASALIQVSQPVSPSMFGISSAEASAAGLKISAGVTPIFWVFFVFVISLVVSCAWLFTEPGHPEADVVRGDVPPYLPADVVGADDPAYSTAGRPLATTAVVPDARETAQDDADPDSAGPQGHDAGAVANERAESGERTNADSDRRDSSPADSADGTAGGEHSAYA
jgi:hypothetical protein